MWSKPLHSRFRRNRPNPGRTPNFGPLANSDQAWANVPQRWPEFAHVCSNPPGIRSEHGPSHRRFSQDRLGFADIRPPLAEMGPHFAQAGQLLHQIWPNPNPKQSWPILP